MRTDRMVMAAVSIALLTTVQSGCGLALRKTAYVGFRVAEQPTDGPVVPAANETPAESADRQRRFQETAAPHAHHKHVAEQSHYHDPGLIHTVGGATRAWLNTAQLKWQRFKAWYIHAYRTTARWPEPYRMLAERAFYDPWDVQAHAGKRFRFGLFDYHFVAGTGELNEMGQRRLGQILRELGPGDREIYVQAALSRAETEERIETVKAALKRSPIAPTDLAIVTIKDAPASMTGEESQRAIQQLTETVGRFPRWMDRNVRMRRSNNSGGGSGGGSRSGY